MKVVLDTNVLISGIGRSGGPPGRIFDAWLAGKFDLVTSEPLIDELMVALTYPKVRKLLRGAGVLDQDLRDYVEILRFKAIVVRPVAIQLPMVPADPRDVPVLEALLASGAEFLVTGDKKHLLSLGMPQIVTAADFAARLKAFDAA